MIKVLHIVPKLDIGGIEAMIYNYYSCMDLEHVHFDFVVYGNEIGHLEKEFIKMGSQVYHVTPKKQNLYKYITELSKILDKNSYDIVHAHQSHLSFWPLMIAKIKRCKIRIAHAHTFMNSKPTLIHSFITLMNHIAANEFAFCGLTPGKWAFGEKVQGKWIVNGISIQKFKFDSLSREKTRKQYHILNSDVVLGMICRFSPEKNINFALEIVNQLILQKKENYKLCIVGDGAERENIEKMIETKKLHNNVILAGRKSNVEDYYNMFDVFLLPSFYEGFPVSLIEAQCAGLHSIVSNTVSNESTITEEVVSLSIEDPNQWVLEILNDQHSDRNFNDQLQMFDIQYLAKDLENYYSSLLKKYN